MFLRHNYLHAHDNIATLKANERLCDFGGLKLQMQFCL